MASPPLSISVTWFGEPDEPSIWVRDSRTGTETRGLPPVAAGVGRLLRDWAELPRDHYAWVDDVDVTQGWSDDDVRREFVIQTDELRSELQLLLGRGWSVDVSPEPGLTCVRLMGEHGAHWPLWVSDGGTCPDDWPMLSATMVGRLEQWAVLADPEHDSEPDPVVTETLRGDLSRELGDRFRVRA